MKRLKTIWNTHPLLSTGFALALCLTLYFILRTITAATYWADPANRDQVLQGWMTPGYIGKSWQIPRDEILAAIGPLPEQQRPTLEVIATQQGIPVADLISRIQTAILAYRTSQ
jgi:hypothetical protein